MSLRQAFALPPGIARALWDGIWSPRPAWWASAWLIVIICLIVFLARQGQHAHTQAVFRVTLVEFDDGYFHPKSEHESQADAKAWPLYIFVDLHRARDGIHSHRTTYSWLYMNNRNTLQPPTGFSDTLILRRWDKIRPALFASVLRDEHPGARDLYSLIDQDKFRQWASDGGLEDILRPGRGRVESLGTTIIRRSLYYAPVGIGIFAILLGFFRLTWLARVKKAIQRLESDMCSVCRYELTNETKICPECGLVVDQARLDHARMLRPWSRRWRVSKA